ncbi:MAG: DUF177 domain-containing protein [Patescibacteria group bacterium]
MNNFFYKIRVLFGGESGQKDEYLDEEKPYTFDLGNHQIVKGVAHYDLTVIKMDDAIVAMAKDFETEIEIPCTKCLKTIKETIEIPYIEREFFLQKPEVIEDEADFFQADRKLMQIDLLEVFRQEILLHFPSFPVCSVKCKGLCITCGNNLNDKKCGHNTAVEPEEDEEVEGEVKALKDLKKFFS